MSINAIGTSVIYGTLLTAEGAKGKEKPGKPVSAKECAELESRKDPVGAQVCYERVLEADPKYADGQLKDAAKLSPDERQKVGSLCRAILKDYFNGKVLMEFKARYFYLPKADGVGRSSMDAKRLAQPLEFFSVAPGNLPSLAADNARRRAEIIAGLKKEVSRMGLLAKEAGKPSFRIVRAFVRIEPGQIVTDSGTFDAVTIVPDRVSVFTPWQNK